MKNSYFGLRTGGRSPKQKNFLASGDRTLTKTKIHCCYQLKLAHPEKFSNILQNH
ncbi:hypothetical protein [Nostoc sp.]|uniref:hypothetical protein n=1 Tax=Nostoc sp. TaxID=1180 RepID=UPI002FF979F4